MKRSLLTLLTAFVLLLAACGSDGAPDRADQPGDSSSTTTGVATEPADPGDDAETPQRIVSLAPTTTEMLYAIGAGDRVVAVDQYSNHPEGAPVTDLSGFSPNIEAIAGHEPDLVVLGRDRDGIVDALEGLGVPTLLLESAADLDEVYEQIRSLGEATGHETEAEELVEDMSNEVDTLVATVPERDEPLTYYYELSADLATATAETFIGGILDLAGLTNIADDVDDAAGGYPQLTAEFILDADPDLIILGHAGDTDVDTPDLADRPGWSDLTAIANDDIIVLDSDIASRWGPRIVELLRTVIEATADR